MDHTSEGLKNLQEDLAHYRKAYAAFTNHFYQSPEIYDIGEDPFRTAVINKLEQCDPLKVLSIGSGTGDLDCINFGRLLNTFGRIENTVVEPSEEAIDKYKKRLASDDHLVKSVSTTWFQKTLQDYRRERKSQENGRFHFISAVHSIYYMSDLKDTIDYLLELLEDGGLLFIMVQNENSGIIKLCYRLRNLNTLPTAYTSKLVYSLLDGSKTEYEIVQLVMKVDITCCFDETSEEGALIVDHLTHVVDFKSFGKSRNFYDSVLQYLKTPDCSVVEGGRVLFREVCDAVVVKKKAY